ncbi:MAG: MFS transporter [Actinomycetes bacterium]
MSEPGTAWANPRFRRIWAGTASSTLGAEIGEIALPLLALATFAASAAELSAVRVAQFLPFLVATMPLGLLVDRRPGRRLRMMVGADLGRFLLLAGMLGWLWLGYRQLAVLYAVVFAASVLTVLYEVASFAFLPTVVPAHQLVDANGKLTATASAGNIGGRGVGGLLVQALSAPVAVGAHGLAYLVSAAALSRIDNAHSPADRSRDAREVESGRGQMWCGLRIAFTHRVIRPLLGEATTFNVFNEVLMLGLLLWLVRDLEMNAGLIGLLFTAGGAGSFVGAWFGSRVTGRFGYGRVLLLTLLVGNGAPLALLGADRVGDLVLPLLCGVFLVMGVGIGIANVHAVSLRQIALPEHLVGRTQAAYRLVAWGAIPLGAALGGAIATAAGGETAVTVGAVGVATSTLWVAFSRVPTLRSIEDARRQMNGPVEGG